MHPRAIPAAGRGGVIYRLLFAPSHLFLTPSPSPSVSPGARSAAGTQQDWAREPHYCPGGSHPCPGGLRQCPGGQLFSGSSSPHCLGMAIPGRGEPASRGQRAPCHHLCHQHPSCCMSSLPLPCLSLPSPSRHRHLSLSLQNSHYYRYYIFWSYCKVLKDVK